MPTMSEYEIVLLLTPQLSEQQAEDFVGTFKSDMLKGAKITFEDFWGKKNLAYPINGETAAFYAVVHCEFDGSGLIALEEEMRLNKNIIRHLITKWPKDAPKMTLEEIEAWNKENLPSNESDEKKEEPKHAPRNRPAPKKAEEPAPKKAEEPAKELDKAELDKQLDSILEDGNL